jgi:hypothetical protein
MYGIGNDPFSGPGEQYGSGDRMVERVMAAEYNLTLQRERGPQAASPSGILAQVVGQWLQSRLSR